MLNPIKALFNGAMKGKRASSAVVTRFAPSPTGYLHAGNYRTAVFSYLYARQNGGKFVLRIEDTDKARSKKEYEDNILESLEWLGLPYDNVGDVPHQSERSDVYRSYIQKLVDGGHAYVSDEAERTEGGRSSVIRFRNPNKRVRFADLIRGDIEFDTTDLGDFVIAKSFDEPIFHLAVVVDDFLMGITHIVRGEDHISNTPRQMLIQEAIGAPTPVYAHLPLVLAHDRSKLSKRHGAQSMTYYRDAGFLPDALLNYMALLGWNPGTEQEIFDLRGLEKAFDITKVQKGGAIFNEEKLRWINKEHIKIMPKESLIETISSKIGKSARAQDLHWNVDHDLVGKLASVLIDRIETFGDIDKLIESQDLDYYFVDPTYDALSLKWKTDTDLDPAAKHLGHVESLLASLPERRWNEEDIKAAVWPYAEKEGRGNVLWPFRFALSGKEKSPNPFTLAGILGKSATLKRISDARKLCETSLEAAHAEAQ